MSLFEVDSLDYELDAEALASPEPSKNAYTKVDETLEGVAA